MNTRSRFGASATQYIVDAMSDLMLEKKFEDITITEIVEKAGVCRMTYYRNFSSKQDVVKRYVEQIGEHMHERIVKAAPQTGEAYFALLFREIRRFIPFLRSVYEARLGEIVITEMFDQMILTLVPQRNRTVQDKRYMVRVFSGVFYSVVMEWAQSDLRETPDQLSASICKYLNFDGRPQYED